MTDYNKIDVTKTDDYKYSDKNEETIVDCSNIIFQIVITHFTKSNEDHIFHTIGHTFGLDKDLNAQVFKSTKKGLEKTDIYNIDPPYIATIIQEFKEEGKKRGVKKIFSTELTFPVNKLVPPKPVNRPTKAIKNIVKQAAKKPVKKQINIISTEPIIHNGIKCEKIKIEKERIKPVVVNKSFKNVLYLLVSAYLLDIERVFRDQENFDEQLLIDNGTFSKFVYLYIKNNKYDDYLEIKNTKIPYYEKANDLIAKFSLEFRNLIYSKFSLSVSTKIKMEIITFIITYINYLLVQISICRFLNQGLFSVNAIEEILYLNVSSMGKSLLFDIKEFFEIIKHKNSEICEVCKKIVVGRSKNSSISAISGDLNFGEDDEDDNNDLDYNGGNQDEGEIDMEF